MSKLQQALSGVQGPNVSTRELRQMEFRGAQVQAQGVNQTNYASQLGGLMEAGVEGVKAYDQYREKQGVERKNEIFQKHLERSEIGKLREDGVLLYQDDVYAMRALDREVGRTAGYNVDEQVKANIDSGLWDTPELWQKGRADLMDTAMKETAEVYGVSPTMNNYLLEGFRSEQSERDFALHDAFGKKKSAELKNIGFVSVSDNLSSQVKAGVPIKDIYAYIEQNSKTGTGMLPNDGLKEKALLQVAKEIANSPGGQDKLDEFFNTEVYLNDKKTTLGTRLGIEGVNSLKLTAAENWRKLNKDNAKWWASGIDSLSTLDGSDPDAANRARELYAEMTQKLDAMEQTEQTTSARMELESAMNRARGNIQTSNEKREAALKKEVQVDSRVAEINSRMKQRMTGRDVPASLDSFTETGNTGAFEKNDYNLAFEAFKSDLASSGMSETEQAIEIRKYANSMPEGETAGAAAWKAAVMEGYVKEGNQVNLAIERGDEVPETPRRDSLLEQYRQNPEQFISDFPDYASEIGEIALVQDEGYDYQTFYKGRMEWNRLDKDAKLQKQVEFTGLLTKNSNMDYFTRLPGDERERMTMLAMGLTGARPETGAKVVEKLLDAKYSKVNLGGGDRQGYVAKRLLQVDPRNPESHVKGQVGLQNYLKAAYGDNVRDLGVRSDAQGRIFVRHPSKPELVVTKEELTTWMKNNKML